MRFDEKLSFLPKKFFRVCLAAGRPSRKMIKSILILFAAFLLPTECLKVVSILPFGSNSHFVIGQSITKSLLKAGHEVTVISPYPLKKPLANYHDIDLSPLLERFKKGMKFRV